MLEKACDLVSYVSPSGNKKSQALWVCPFCDTLFQALTVNVKRGHTKSCGCLARKRASETKTKHRQSGYNRTPEYVAWNAIKQRCHNPKRPDYKNYGGRGIKVCDEWMDSFEAFYEHIGPKPDPDFTIDRIDNDGNYEPGNVRWATWTQQQNNKRNNRRDSCRSK